MTHPTPIQKTDFPGAVRARRKPGDPSGTTVKWRRVFGGSFLHFMSSYYWWWRVSPFCPCDQSEMVSPFSSTFFAPFFVPPSYTDLRWDCELPALQNAACVTNPSRSYGLIWASTIAFHHPGKSCKAPSTPGFRSPNPLGACPSHTRNRQAHVHCHIPSPNPENTNTYDIALNVFQ